MLPNLKLKNKRKFRDLFGRPFQSKLRVMAVWVENIKLYWENPKKTEGGIQLTSIPSEEKG